MGQITIEKPTEEKLKELNVKDWGIWECEVKEFPWEYDDKETCYILEGKVTVTAESGETVEINKGDLVTFPRGMKCRWNVRQNIRKHYKFG